MYLTYSEYIGYGGTLDNATFTKFAFRAEAMIDYATFNRLQDETVIPEQVKHLVAHIVDMVYKKGESLNLGNSTASGTSSNQVGGYITNQSNDGVSVSYNNVPAEDLYKLCDQDIQNAIRTYLSGVKNSLGRYLLYRGLYRGE